MTIRRTLASFGLLAAMAFPALGATSVSAATELLPNLKTLKPTGLYVQVTTKGVHRLRLSNEIVNVQTGPLELEPKPEDCNGNGDPNDDRTAYQVVYADTNGNGVLDRGTDQVSRTVKAGCMLFHPAHNHWHFQNYARYQLLTLDGTRVTRGTKTSFCITDTERKLPDVPGSPAAAYYTMCDADSTMGMSPGWGDIYQSFLQGQWIVIDGVPDGDYCLESTADPANQVIETNDADNVAKVAIHLHGTNVRIINVACP